MRPVQRALIASLAIGLLSACSHSGPTAFSGPISRDIGDIAVLQDTGDLVNVNNRPDQPDLTSNGIPAAQKFYATHPDDVYDFLVIFTSTLTDRAWYFRTQNFVQGIGVHKFDITAQVGSRGRLKGIIFMGGVRSRVSRGSHEVPERTLDLLAEEMGHQWAAYVRFNAPPGLSNEALLGRGRVHWSPLFDTGGSALEGFAWRDNRNGTFTAGAYKRGIYSPLDLYLMGFYGPGEVPPMRLILSPEVSQDEIVRGEAPIRSGTTISGTALPVMVDDISVVEGRRLPEVGAAQKTFRAAFLLVTSRQPELSDLLGIDAIRRAWSERFHQITHERGTCKTTLERVSL